MTHAELRGLIAACDAAPSTKLILAILGTHADGEGRARPSRETLCQMTGLKDRRVRAILAELIEAGWLQEITLDGFDAWQILPREPGNVVPKSGNVVPDAGNVVPEIGNVVPKIGNVVPPLLYIREEPRRYKEGEGTDAGARAGEDDETVEYRGTRQPLARLAWAERTARQQLDVIGVDAASLDGQDLRAEWQAFLVRRAEKALAHQAPMLAVDQAARQLRQIVALGGVAEAVEAVRFALARDWSWPTAKPSTPSAKRLNPANNSQPSKLQEVNTYGL